jgi:hypothetical protein
VSRPMNQYPWQCRAAISSTNKEMSNIAPA